MPGKPKWPAGSCPDRIPDRCLFHRPAHEAELSIAVLDFNLDVMRVSMSESVADGLDGNPVDFIA